MSDKELAIRGTYRLTSVIKPPEPFSPGINDDLFVRFSMNNTSGTQWGGGHVQER